MTKTNEEKKLEKIVNNYQLSDDDQNLLREVSNRILIASAEHSVVRQKFLGIQRKYEEEIKKNQEEEKTALEKVGAFQQEQNSFLMHIAKQMKVPQGYVLDADTMTWIPDNRNIQE